MRVSNVLVAAVAIFFGSTALANAGTHHGRHHHYQRSVHRVHHHQQPQQEQVQQFGWPEWAPTQAIGNSLVSTARGYIGTNPTGQSSLWCADFMNLVERQTGHKPTGSREAKSFLSKPHLPGPQVGAIAVLRRSGGGHVGVVTGTDANGNPIVVSGNHGRKGVGESVYPKDRVIAYVSP